VLVAIAVGSSSGASVGVLSITGSELSESELDVAVGVFCEDDGVAAAGASMRTVRAEVAVRPVGSPACAGRVTT